MATAIRWDRRAVKNLESDPDTVKTIEEIAQEMAARMSLLAPHNTGGGADSIDVRPDRRKPEAVDVGWDAEHYYLIFPEFGTEFQAQQWFAHRALYEFDYH